MHGFAALHLFASFLIVLAIQRNYVIAFKFHVPHDVPILLIFYHANDRLNLLRLLHQTHENSAFSGITTQCLRNTLRYFPAFRKNMMQNVFPSLMQRFAHSNLLAVFERCFCFVFLRIKTMWSFCEKIIDA